MATLIVQAIGIGFLGFCLVYAALTLLRALVAMAVAIAKAGVAISVILLIVTLAQTAMS